MTHGGPWRLKGVSYPQVRPQAPTRADAAKIAGDRFEWLAVAGLGVAALVASLILWSCPDLLFWLPPVP